MNAARLPPSVRVIERGYLNCNQVVLLDGGDNVLIDSGYCTHREETLELLAGPAGLDGAPLERIVNTHCHADHVGGNAAVASVYGCTITVPAGEVKHVVPWTARSVWMRDFDQRADPFQPDETLAPGDRFAAGGFEWTVHAAPGHDMDALMYFEPRNRILVSGDALWENGMGFVWPQEGESNPFVASARETLARIEALDPAIVIPGHGAPFTDVAGSLVHVRARLEAFEREPARAARHAARTVFVFSLLDHGPIALGDVPRAIERIGCLRGFMDRFLHLDDAGMARWLLEDLGRSGAITLDGGIVRPTARP